MSRLSASEHSPAMPDKGASRVCPFCGGRKDPAAACPRCTMADTPATRAATIARIGPWFVLQSKTPSAPGMRFETLRTLISKGHVTPKSILRGPTTQQLWSVAGKVRGVSRLFGKCFQCAAAMDKDAAVCGVCNADNRPPLDVDALMDRPGQSGASAAGTAAASASAAPATHTISASATPDAPPRQTARVFGGVKGGRTPNALGHDAILSPAHLAAAFQLSENSRKHRRGRIVWIGLTLAALLAIAAAALTFDTPELRQKLMNKFEQVKSKIESKLR